MTSAQEPAMNDSTSRPSADGSLPADFLQAALTHDEGPSLASAGDRNEPSPSGGNGDHGSLREVPNSAATGNPTAQDDVPPLEERLRRLEDALAQVPDPRQFEHRIAERVAERLSNARTIPVAQIVPAPSSAQGPSVNLPAGMILDVGKRLFTTTASMANAAPRPEHQESAVMNGVRRTFLFFDMLTEARAIWCMYTDPRYKMSWAGRMVPLGLAVFLLTSAFLIPGAQLTGIGTIIDKLADLIPAFILFKLLTYEARRYRETAPDLPPDLRL
jgi:hypothetical protein